MKKITLTAAFLAALLMILTAACAKRTPATEPTDEPSLSVYDPAGETAEQKNNDPTSELVSVPPAQETEETTTEPAAESTTEPTETADDETETSAPTEATTAFTPEEDESLESEPATVIELEESTAPAPADTASEKAKNIARLALDLIGSEFELGASGPSTFDNSGFVYYCCRENGVNVPRRTGEIAAAGEEVALEALQPGDIVIFSLEVGGEPGFTGIYVGDGQFVSCNTTESPTGVRSLLRGHWAERFICGRRVA